MKPVVARQILKEITFSLWNIWILKAFLGGSVVFLLTYMLLLLINLPAFLVALSIGLLYFITELVTFSRTDPLRVVEKRYELLNEALRTVNDTLTEENELVDTLREDVRKNVRHLVDVGDFIDFRRVISRVFFLLFISFSIVFVASLNIQVVDVSKALDTSLSFLKSLGEETFKEGRSRLQVVQQESALQDQFNRFAETVGITAGDQAGDDIFGSASLAQLSGETMEVQIRASEFEVNIDDYKPPEETSFTNQQFQGRVEEQRELSLQDDIPQEQQAIVRRYFEQLAQS